MALTFEEVKERLKTFDEVTLLEMLDISSEELVERFEDEILHRIDELEEEVADEEDN